MRTTSDPCHKGWDFFASSAGLGHHNPYRAASRGRVVHSWGNRENAGDSHAACLSVRLCVSIPLAGVAGLSRTFVETTDEVAHRVLERTYPRLVECRNRPMAVAHGKRMLYGLGQNVPDGGEMTACRLRVS